MPGEEKREDGGGAGGGLGVSYPRLSAFGSMMNAIELVPYFV